MQHTSPAVPVAATSADMEIIWILLTVGLTYADKLDNTYLPPEGSAYSGGSPGAINVPLDLPKTQSEIHDERLGKNPELVKGIDRVGPNEAQNIFENVSNQPTYNYFEQSSSMPQIQAIAEPISGIPKALDPQKIDNVEKQPIFSIIDENNRAYLPPYSKKSEKNAETVVSSSSPVINQENLRDNRIYNQPDSIFNQYSSMLHSTNQPHESTDFSTPSIKQHSSTIAGNNITPDVYRSSLDPDNFSSIPIQTSDKNYSALDKVKSQRPERIQAESDRQATIINYGQTLTPKDFAYGYDSSNGIHADEEGITANGVKAKGSYSYIGDDGTVYKVEYTADENGFIPKGAHLPTPPPVPDAILKVIEQAAKDKEAGIYDDGSYNEEKYGPQSGDKLNDSEDLQKVNEQGLENIIEKNKQNKNRYNNIPYEGDFQNNDSPNNELIKNDNDLSFIRKQYKNYPDESNNFFRTTQKPDTTIINDKTDRTKSQSISGYEYFPPQNPVYDTDKFESFPSRFSGTEEDYGIVAKENREEKVTAKPFLTPYVLRKGDDTEVNYSDKQENEENFKNSPTRSGFVQDNAKPEDKSTHRDGEINSHEIKSGERPQYGEKLRNSLVSDDEGYFYQSARMPFMIDNPRISPAPSTVLPTEFPSHISSTQRVNITPERAQSSHPQSKTTPFGTPATKSPVLFPATQTNRPIFINEGTSTYPNAYTKNEVFPKITPTSSASILPGVTRSGMTYEAHHRNVHFGPSSTENVVGEDFTGPKQAQRFDPATGYHY